MNDTSDIPPTDPAAESGEPKTYEAAVARLEQIIARLDSGKSELRETLELCREGKGLVEFCKTELDQVSGELRELDLDKLVAALQVPEGSADTSASR